MPIRQFHEIFLPLLRGVADGNGWTLAALRGPIADDFGLTAAPHGPKGRADEAYLRKDRKSTRLNSSHRT